MIQEYDVLVPLMTRFDEEVINSAAGGFSDHGKKLSKCKLILQFGVGRRSGHRRGDETRHKSRTNPVGSNAERASRRRRWGFF